MSNAAETDTYIEFLVLQEYIHFTTKKLNRETKNMVK